MTDETKDPAAELLCENRELRRRLFEAMDALRNGKIKVTEANTLLKVAREQQRSIRARLLSRARSTKTVKS